jgi:hypothetical protein
MIFAISPHLAFGSASSVKASVEYSIQAHRIAAHSFTELINDPARSGKHVA